MTIEELTQKPVAMMTGEELSFLIDSRMAAWATEIASLSQRRIYYLAKKAGTIKIKGETKTVTV